MKPPLTIVARKPAYPDEEGSTVERVVVDRGECSMRYVSATINAHSLVHGEWYWGHYFATLDEAMRHFNSRPPFNT